VKLALDTNILVYAEGVNGRARAADARALLGRLSPELVIIPVQALGELYTVLTRKAGWPEARARAAVTGWRDAYALHATSETVFLSALDLASAHRLSMWDAIILAVAAEAGCRLLLSEDLQSGLTWRGVTVVDPFAEETHPLLAALTG
jgi:predicted nucleic acid-binding protein